VQTGGFHLCKCMRLFDNSAINRTYLHSTLQILAEYSGGVFVFVYLLKAGIAVPLVLCAISSWALGRLILRRVVLPAAIQFGLRNCLVFGTAIDAVGYLILGQVHGLGALLYVYILTSAFGNCFYWTCYHTTVATLGNAEQRGSQVSALAAIAALNSIIGPLLGGFLLVHAGAVYGFMVAAALQALSILPLLTLQNLPVARVAKVDALALQQARRIYFADGLGNASGFFIWALALFQTLGESFSSFGAALAIAGGVAAAMTLGLGRLIDLGHSKHAQQIAYGIMALSLVLKSVGYSQAWSAVAANALGAVAGPLYWSAMMSRVYNLAQSSSCPLRFQMAGEGAWDFGTALGCFVAAALIWVGLGFSWPLILGVGAAAFGYASLTKSEAA
jgi:MFS transporter, DHA1 family, inner membrane transport protein